MPSGFWLFIRKTKALQARPSTALLVTGLLLRCAQAGVVGAAAGAGVAGGAGAAAVGVAPQMSSRALMAWPTHSLR